MVDPGVSWARSWPAFSWATGSARWASGGWTPSVSPPIVFISSSARVSRAWLPESSRSLRKSASRVGSAFCMHGRASAPLSRAAVLARRSCLSRRPRRPRTVSAQGAPWRVPASTTCRRSATGRRLIRAKAPARGLVSVRLKLGRATGTSACSAGTAGSWPGPRRSAATSSPRASCAGASGSWCRRAASAATRRRAHVSIHFTRIAKTKARRFSLVDVATPTRADRQPPPGARPRRDRARRRGLGRGAAARTRRRSHAARGGLPLPRAGRRPRRAGAPERAPRPRARAGRTSPRGCRAAARPTGACRTTTSR